MKFFFYYTCVEARSKDAIRNARGLNRFIYIACSPKAAFKNWVDFARPCSKTLKGEPFIVTQAGGVDMFPHTAHKEMILLFERVINKPVTENENVVQSCDNEKTTNEQMEVEKS